MSISGTNRIYNSQKDIKYLIDKGVNRILNKIPHSESRKYLAALRHFKTRPAFCTKCDGPMRPDYARKQLENKMENAPICLPCILGYKRK